MDLNIDCTSSLDNKIPGSFPLHDTDLTENFGEPIPPVPDVGSNVVINEHNKTIPIFGSPPKIWSGKRVLCSFSANGYVSLGDDANLLALILTNILSTPLRLVNLHLQQACRTTTTAMLRRIKVNLKIVQKMVTINLLFWPN
ncbi:hypothetical protein AAHC03_010147 [Spirometra sp. Aus1]